jgi:hypothetical protein
MPSWAPTWAAAANGLRLSRRVLRSKTAELVRQEFYGQRMSA